MTQHPRARVAGAAIILVLTACQSTPLAPDVLPRDLPLAEQAPAAGQTARRIATVRFYDDPTVVDVPAAARAGEPVTVTVTTYGGGCIREDTTVATVAGAQADVVPYQLVYTPRVNEACTLELRITRRTARFTFAAPGPARVVVTGRASPGDSLLHIVRAIEVR